MICPYCGSAVSLASSAIVYSGRDYGNVWLCDNWPKCDAYVGAHKSTNVPLGRLANAELREWRKRAHSVFDSLWQSGEYTRTEAYAIMQQVMGMTEDEAHIGKFDVEECKRLISTLKFQ